MSGTNQFISQTREDARRRVERIGLFRAELAQLEAEGALNLAPDQQAKVEAHWDRLTLELRERYCLDKTVMADRVSWGMKIASLLGGAALFASLVLFLHRIWGSLPTAAQVMFLTVGPLGLLAAAAGAATRGVDRYYTGLLLLAAGAAFVAELNVLGVVLNMAESPQALLVWGSFAVLVAYASGLRLLLAGGLVLLNAYSAALLLKAGGHYWADFFQRTQLLIPGAALLYSLPWIIQDRGPQGFDFVYRACGATMGLGALLLLSTTGDLCLGRLNPSLVAGIYQMAGLVLSAGVVAHGVRLVERALLNIGAVSFMIFLFTRLHAWWWDWMPKYLFFLIIGLIAFGLLLVFRRLQVRPLKGAAI